MTVASVAIAIGIPVTVPIRVPHAAAYGREKYDCCLDITELFVDGNHLFMVHFIVASASNPAWGYHPKLCGGNTWNWPRGDLSIPPRAGH